MAEKNIKLMELKKKNKKDRKENGNAEACLKLYSNVLIVKIYSVNINWYKVSLSYSVSSIMEQHYK